MTMTEPQLKEGRVVAIAGPVIDIEFPRGSLPEINHALELDITLEDTTDTLIAEVAQQLGEGRVRAICMKPTDGLTRGTPVRNTGHGVQGVIVVSLVAPSPLTCIWTAAPGSPRTILMTCSYVFPSTDVPSTVMTSSPCFSPA